MSNATEQSETPAILTPEYIYKKYSNMVWVILCRKIESPDSRKDALHDVFVKFLEHIDKVEPFKYEGAAVNWLKITAYTTAVDYMRKSNTYNQHVCVMLDDENTPELPDDSVSCNPHEMLEINDTSATIRNLIIQLRPKHYQVMLLHYSGEFSVKEIAARLQLPEQTVYSRLKMAEKIICRKIDEGGLLNDKE